jgi:hypothetical protein
MANTVTTIQGDTWDQVAFRLWGPGGEVLCDRLMALNPEHSQTAFFSGGVELKIPATDGVATRAAPFWQEAG